MHQNQRVRKQHASYIFPSSMSHSYSCKTINHLSSVKRKYGTSIAKKCLCIILHMCKGSFGYLLSTEAFYSILSFCLRTSNALIRLWLFSYARCVITKTCLYNFDPLKPQSYIVKLGFTRVYIIFLIFAQNINCGYSLEPHR